MKNFRDLTKGHHVLMGRKTFQSLAGALPARDNLVVSGDRSIIPRGFYLFASPLEARDFAEERGEPELFIIGGASIYEFFMVRRLVDRMYLTEVDYRGEADVFFPKFSDSDWETRKTQYFEENGENDHGGCIRTLVRRETAASSTSL